MTNTTQIDWNIVAALLPQPVADAYHLLPKAGAVRYAIDENGTDAPPSTDHWWAVYDAFCCLYARPGDKYAAETLVLAHGRMVRKIAYSVIDDFTPSAGKKKKSLRTGVSIEELVSAGIAATWKALQKACQIDNDIGPDDPDIMEQVASYLGTAAKNEMLAYVREMYSFEEFVDMNEFAVTNEFVAQLSVSSAADVVIEQESHARAENAVVLACKDDKDKAICQLRADGRLSESEIGRRLDLSRDQVHRRIDKIQRLAEDELQLPHHGREKRKSREPQGDGIKDSDVQLEAQTLP
jgi:DNA-directed RNA polymerase specialized sigma24 family protein